MWELIDPQTGETVIAMHGTNDQFIVDPINNTLTATPDEVEILKPDRLADTTFWAYRVNGTVVGWLSGAWGSMCDNGSYSVGVRPLDRS